MRVAGCVFALPASQAAVPQLAGFTQSSRYRVDSLATYRPLVSQARDNGLGVDSIMLGKRRAIKAGIDNIESQGRTPIIEIRLRSFL